MADGEQVACHKCQSEIMDPQYIKADPHIYHLSCFICDKCQTDLSSQQFATQNDQNFCKNCYLAQFAHICTSCKEQIAEKFIIANEQYFHPEHFTCETCTQPLEGDKFYYYEQKRYCHDCFIKLHGGVCDSCKELITDTAYKACNQTWHKQCLLCTYCKQSFQDLKYIECEQLVYHEECWEKKSKGEGEAGTSETTAAVLEEVKQDEVEEQKSTEETQKQEELEAQKIKDQEEAAAAEQKAQEDEAKMKEDQENEAKKQAEEEAEAKKREDEEAETKRLADEEEEAKKKQAEDEAAAKKQADEEEETKKKAQEATKQQTAQQQAKKKSAEEVKGKGKKEEEKKQKGKEETKKKGKEEAKAASGGEQGGTYSFEQLTSADLPAGVDPQSKEMWLNDAEFKTKFGMDKAAFGKLPKWKQVTMKKKQGFF